MNPKARRVVIVLRQTVDWHELARLGHYDTSDFERFTARPQGHIAGLIAFWNRTFSVGFYQVRAAMKDIASESLRAVANAPLMPLHMFAPPFDPQALYAFIDDDDWFAPHLASALLSSAAATSDGAVWISSRFTGETLARPNDGFCFSNNYCVHGNFLARQAARAGEAIQHMDAQRMLHEEGVSLALLNDHLSVTNKHPCSLLRMEQHPGMAALTGLLEPFRRYAASNASEGSQSAEGLAWAAPYMRRTSRYLAGLSPRPEIEQTKSEQQLR